MTNNTYNFKTGDAPELTEFVEGNATLSGADVTFSMKPVVARGVVTVDSQPATIGDYDGERDVTEVSYTLSSSDTSEDGDYLAEFEVTYDDGEIRTYPRGRYYFISIESGV